MRISKMWNELSMREKREMIRVAVKHGITNLADIRAKYNEFALGGNLYDDGGPKTRYTADGRTLTYSTVPETGQVRWIDFSDSKDFDGVTDYRFYDNAGNKMHYTRWQETAPEVTVQPAPTKSEVDNLVRARGYNPDITRPMWRLSRMPHEQGLQGVYPEFALLTGGRSLVNGALGYIYDAAKPYAAQAWQAMKPGGSFWTTYQKPITQFAESMLLGESANEAARISGYNGWGDFAATTVEKATGHRPNEMLMDLSNPYYLGRELPQVAKSIGKTVFDLGKTAFDTTGRYMLGNEEYNAAKQQARSTFERFKGQPAEEWAEMGAAKLSNASPFKSELDWSPEGWFGTRATGVYDTEDIAALQSHIPEYLEIEKTAKANGTWLKMPDGSTWQGDPRSWVQMQSRAYDVYTGKSPFKYQPFSHTTDSSFDTFDISKFGVTDEGFYGKGFYTHPAENINGQLTGRNTYGDTNYLLTTNVQHPFDLTHPNFEYAGLFNRSNTNAPLGLFDGYDAVYYGIPGETMVGAYPSELVVPDPTNYKSLLGNNGNFDRTNSNMFKALFPFTVIGGGTAATKGKY